MVDFILSPLTGDLDFGDNNSTGLQLHIDEREEAAQRLRQALALNLAEWFVNVNLGLPFIKNNEEGIGLGLRYFMGDKAPNAAPFVASALDLYIVTLPFVNNLNSSSFSFNRKAREFTYTFEVELIGGETLSFPFTTILDI